jgi:hypothetical protein
MVGDIGSFTLAYLPIVKAYARRMERTMRRKIKKEDIMLQGWNNRDTVKPTSFMMASKFPPFSWA